MNSCIETSINLALKVFSVSVLIVSLAACDSGEKTVAQAAPKAVEAQAVTKLISAADEMAYKQEVAEYWRTVSQDAAVLRRSLAILQEQVAEFLASPKEESLIELRRQWLQSYTQFQKINHIAQFSVAAPNIFVDQKNIWLAIDAYPIAPGYIDDIKPYKNIGVVNAQGLELNAANVRSQHALTDTSEAVLGFMPLAFLLWGEDEGLAQRVAKYRLDSQQLAIERRRQLLEISSQALYADALVLEQRLNDTGEIDVLFYRLPVMAQLELIRASLIVYLERRIEPALQVANDDWKPEEVWAEVLMAQLAQFKLLLDLLIRNQAIEFIDLTKLEHLIVNTEEKSPQLPAELTTNELTTNESATSEPLASEALRHELQRIKSALSR